MLRQRIVTAIALVAAVLIAIFALPRVGFQLFLGVVIGIGAWEWATMLQLAIWPRVLYLIGIAVLVLGLYVAGPAAVLPLMAFSALWWVVAFWLVLRYPEGGNWWQRRPVALALGMLVLVPGLAALDLLRAQPGHAAYILMFIALVASADIGAYFSGRRFGRTRLAPRVSPNKTWEGVYGGVVLTTIVGLLAFAWVVPVSGASVANWVVALLGCLLLAAYSVVGDLFESMLKRHCQVKDSGRLLPGHGGILDRLDSLTAALPVYVLTLSMLDFL